ncbi:MAG: hypothetical protein HGA96_02145 [Desulfobulbaceae bacterium]|nr:hypothetical protein [Desulfobulbaceae bacterium]
MELKSLSGIVLLLVLQATNHLQPALAAAGPLPAAAASKPGLVSRSGEAENVAANWDRDLFEIFREEPGMEKDMPLLVVPKRAEAIKQSTIIKKSPPLRALKLQGIVISDDEHAAALVDGKIVRPGEVVGGWLVRLITRHGLLVEGPDGKKTFELLADSARARVSSRAIVAPE